MTTITELVDRVQLLLNDSAAAIWAQTDLEEWLVDGVRDYSIHFPRLRNTAWLCVAGQQEYELPEDFIAVVNVEHPTGEEPPRYLTRLARTHPTFWLRDDYYDVEPSRANAAAIGYLWLSGKPAGGETTTLLYYGYHSPAVNVSPVSDIAISVPAHHEHLVEQYMIWQAHLERLNTEIQAPDTTTGLIQQYKLASEATEAAYRTSLRNALNALSAGGISGPWRVDVHDRIY